MENVVIQCMGLVVNKVEIYILMELILVLCINFLNICTYVPEEGGSD